MLLVVGRFSNPIVPVHRCKALLRALMVELGLTPVGDGLIQCVGCCADRVEVRGDRLTQPRRRLHQLVNLWVQPLMLLLSILFGGVDGFTFLQREDVLLHIFCVLALLLHQRLLVAASSRAQANLGQSDGLVLQPMHNE